MRRLLLLAALLLLAIQPASAYTYKLLVSVQLAPEGNGTVTETVTIGFENASEVSDFDAIARDIESKSADAFTAWKRVSPNTDYHVLSGIVSNSTRLVAKRNECTGFVNPQDCKADIILKYDIAQPIVSAAPVNQRTTTYSLLTDKLQLSRTGSEIVLPPGWSLEFILPKDAMLITSLPEPSNGLDQAKKDKRVRWDGRLTGRLEMVYEREQALGEEVTRFFQDLYSQLFVWAPLIVLAAFGLFAAWRIVKLREK